MYEYTIIKSPLDLLRTREGVIGCGHNECDTSYRRYPASVEGARFAWQPAALVFVEFGQKFEYPDPEGEAVKVETVQLHNACRKHGGNIKAQITRRTYHARSLKVVSTDPTAFYASGDVETLRAGILAQKALEQRSVEQARADYIANAKPGLLAAHLSDESDVISPSATVTEVDDYGRVFVRVDAYFVRAMTPAQARRLAVSLVSQAQRAEEASK